MNIIDLWRIDLDDRRWERWFDSLSPDELACAHTWRDRTCRLRYLRGRSALRMLLGRYAGVPARRLAFHYGATGKPALACGRWQFNLSHSGALALLAVSTAPVGVDVERRVGALDDSDALCAALCHPCERAALLAMSGPARSRRLVGIWTAKEAYVKATGDGLARALRAIALVRPARGGASVLDEAAADGAPWFVRRVPVDPMHAAAVCTPLERASLRRFEGAGLLAARHRSGPGPLPALRSFFSENI